MNRHNSLKSAIVFVVLLLLLYFLLTGRLELRQKYNRGFDNSIYLTIVVNPNLQTAPVISTLTPRVLSTRTPQLSILEVYSP